MNKPIRSPWDRLLRLSWVFLFFSSCTPNGQPPESAVEEEIRLGVVLFDLPWAHSIVEGMRAALPEGVSLTARIHDFDIIREGELIREINPSIDALLIASIDPNASVPAIKLVSDLGKPVIGLDSGLNAEDTEEYLVGVYASDSSMLGYRMGAYLAQWLAERKLADRTLNENDTLDLGILHCDRSPSCLERSEAFRASLRDHGVEWRELANREAYTKTDAVNVAKEILTEFPSIQVLWAANEGGTEGAVTAVRELGLAGGVYVFGTDLPAEINRMLRDDDGVLQAVTGQESFEIGRQAVLGAVAVLRDDLGKHYRSIETPFYSRDHPERLPPLEEPAHDASESMDRPPE